MNILRTAIDDLKGVARLAAAAVLPRFLCVGLISTLAYVIVYSLLSGPFGAGSANAVALVEITALANTAANRRSSSRPISPPPSCDLSR